MEKPTEEEIGRQFNTEALEPRFEIWRQELAEVSDPTGTPPYDDCSEDGC